MDLIKEGYIDSMSAAVGRTRKDAKICSPVSPREEVKKLNCDHQDPFISDH